MGRNCTALGQSGRFEEPKWTVQGVNENGPNELKWRVIYETGRPKKNIKGRLAKVYSPKVKILTV